MAQSIYTRRGDDGHTDLLGGRRPTKYSDRISLLGELDELNAAIGVARAAAPAAANDAELTRVQEDLFRAGAIVAGAADAQVALDGAAVARLEKVIDARTAELPALRAFILPGGAPAAAQLHLARCVCRRAERAACRLPAASETEAFLIAYLNRLSDLLFVLARHANLGLSVVETEWHPMQSAGDD